MTIDHSSFQSPFSWRYASAEMRAIWSESQQAPVVAAHLGGAGRSASRGLDW